MKNILQHVFGWLERNARSAREREVERYLGEATDLADLERRMQELTRRGDLLR
jgi:Protein of unknown function (DUF3563)